jgi:hypothetical protein
MEAIVPGLLLYSGGESKRCTSMENIVRGEAHAECLYRKWWLHFLDFPVCSSKEGTQILILCWGIGVSDSCLDWAHRHRALVIVADGAGQDLR